ncbi:unnamed protein product [Calypogeia fissa]
MIVLDTTIPTLMAIGRSSLFHVKENFEPSNAIFSLESSILLVRCHICRKEGFSRRISSSFVKQNGAG